MTEQPKFFLITEEQWEYVLNHMTCSRREYKKINEISDTIRSHPAPAADTLEQTAIEELLAIEGYVNGIYYGDESPKRMCEHISTSIGVIRNVIKERESLRREVQE